MCNYEKKACGYILKLCWKIGQSWEQAYEKEQAC